MILNPFGRIIDEEWNKSLEIRNNIALHEYIIMPNHFHAILEIIFPHPGADESKLDGRGSGESIFANKGEGEIIRGEYQFATTGFKSPSHTIGAIIRGFKGITTKRIKELYLGGEFNWGEYRFATTGSDNSERGEFPFAPTIPDKIWQRNYYEHIIRTEKAYINISQYIINNPANWKKDSLK
jgi:REP element-mobilizing transposase RayT